MNLAQLTSSDLKVIAQLVKEKEALEARLAKLNSRLAAYGSEPPSGAVKAPQAKSPKVRRRRAPASAAKPAPVSQPAPALVAKPAGQRPGKLKEKIIALLQGAGSSGITVRDIAAKVGLHPQRIYVWFNATGKSIKEIKKVAPATYAWSA